MLNFNIGIEQSKFDGNIVYLWRTTRSVANLKEPIWDYHFNICIGFPRLGKKKYYSR